MSDEYTYYHNPRCTKSREGLTLLQENGVEPQVIEYLKARLTPREIGKIFTQLGGDFRKAVRTNEPIYEEVGLTKDSSREDLIQAIADHPVLLQRPIFVSGDRAVIGRPPEMVLDLLQDV